MTVALLFQAQGFSRRDEDEDEDEEERGGSE
jgi:hypothetical protein